MRCPRSYRRWLPAVLLVPAALAAQDRMGVLRAQLELEEAMLEEEVRSYLASRQQQEAALEAARQAALELDEAVARDTLEIDGIEGLATERLAAEAAARILSRQVDESLSRLVERARRSQLLRRELDRLTGGETLADPVTGRWRVDISSPPVSGVFDLRLEGTSVAGTYTLADGRSGSLEGTYVGDRLRLQRIDSERGLDGTFEGTVDAAAGVVRGFWSPSRLSEGGPGGSGWMGVRVSSGPPEESEAGSEGGEEEQGESG